MIENFLKYGVTAEIYSAAIDAMDADGRYIGNKPTSNETWAINCAEKQYQLDIPAGRKQTKTNEELLDELYESGQL